MLESVESVPLYPVLVDGRWGFIDRGGVLVVQPQFVAADEFSGGFARVGVGEDVQTAKHTYIDAAGRQICRAILGTDFDLASGFSEGFARVNLNGRWGFIGADGEFAIPPQFDLAGRFSEGLAAVEVGGHPGYIDRTGRLVVRLDVSLEEEAGDFHDGLACLRVSEGGGYIDRSGSFVIQPQYLDPGDFADGTAWAAVEHEEGGENYGLIDKTGEFVLDPQYDYVQPFSEGLALVGLCDSEGTELRRFVGRNGKVMIDLLEREYDRFGNFSEGLVCVGLRESGQSLCGLVDRRGRWRLEPTPDVAWVYEFRDGLARIVLQDHEVGYIDKSLRYVWEPRK